MSEEFNLSEKRSFKSYLKALGLSDIKINNLITSVEIGEKEFVRLTLEDIQKWFDKRLANVNWIELKEDIKKRAGEKLTK